MCFPFLAAQGHSVGASLCAEGDLDPARRALAAALETHCRLELPQDLVLAQMTDDVPEPRALDGVDVPDGWTGLDIGPRTAERYAREIARAHTAFWNGPMGRFELDPFAAVSATTVVGGGETVAALRRFGLGDSVTHVSTGGGATLELLEGRSLPGVRALLAPAGVR
jgi:phosphoglycerate kinase